MKITIKTTQQKVFHVDAELSDTISDVKSKIQEAQGHLVTDQKIIYSGKILSDDKTIESCGIKEKDFLVLMVTKRKLTPSAVASSTLPSVASAPVVTNETAPPLTSPSHESASMQSPSSFLSGEALQTTIQNMVEMGFPREQVIRALRASFNNPDRAVEYLMNGIPAHLGTEAVPASSPASQSGAEGPNTSVPAASAPLGHQNLFQLAHQQQHQQPYPTGSTAAIPDLSSALRDNPQIQQLRELVSQNPTLVQPLIQQLGSQDPTIAQLFAQHPEILIQLLNPPEVEGDDEGNAQGSPQVISVTEEERAAIARLEALGFPRYAAVEAYFACDKNEELAANYLFERGSDD